MITQHAYRGASADADRVLSPLATEPQASPPIRVTPALRVQDIREPTLREHETMMERGSKKLIDAIWQHHPKLRATIEAHR